MALYNIGAVGLLLNVLSCSAVNHYHPPSAGLSLAMLLYTLMFCWFLIDYVMFEKVHLYTYGTVL